MSDAHSLRLPARQERYDELMAFALANSPPAIRPKVELVLEEVLLNIMDYAYTREGARAGAQALRKPSDAAASTTSRDGPAPAADGEVEIRLEPIPGDGAGINPSPGLRVVVVDWGAPFNPLAQPAPDVQCALDKRNVGGLGILLVRTMASDVRYQRRDGANVLELEFAEPTAPPPESPC